MADISFSETLMTLVISLVFLRDSELQSICKKIYRFLHRQYAYETQIHNDSYHGELKLKIYSLTEHLQELRLRTIIVVMTVFFAILLIFPFCWDIIYFLTKPLIFLQGEDLRFNFIYTKLTEAFITELRIATVFGVLISLPVIIYQVYMFFAPALYKNERTIIIPYLVASPLLFILGVLIVYYLVMPISYRFFISFQTVNDGLSLYLAARISEYIELVTELFLVFGFAFQLPIMTYFLAKTGIISVNTLCNMRRYVTVTLFIIAAIVTPPDVISQILLATPLILLYEMSIFFCRIKNV